MQKIANWYFGHIELVGANSQTSVLTFPLGLAGVGFGETEAANALNQIRGALVNITDANVKCTWLTRVYETSNVIPASGDVFEVAVINTHLNAPTEMEKIHSLYVPAPSIGIFAGSAGTARDMVDSLDADLIDYVQQVSQHSYVSDGEQINTSSGGQGISLTSPGRRITRKVKRKK